MQGRVQLPPMWQLWLGWIFNLITLHCRSSSSTLTGTRRTINLQPLLERKGFTGVDNSSSPDDARRA